MSITLLNSGSAQSATLSLQQTTGSNRRLVVVAHKEVSGGTTVSGVTYNAIALTKVTDGVTNAHITQGDDRIEMWELLEADLPADGTYDIVVTWVNTGGEPQTAAWLMQDCTQSAPDDVEVSSGTNNGSLSQTLSALAANRAVLTGIGIGNLNPPQPSGTSIHTERGQQIAASSGVAFGDALESGTSGDKTVGWQTSDPATVLWNRSVMVTAAYAEASGGAAPGTATVKVRNSANDGWI